MMFYFIESVFSYLRESLSLLDAFATPCSQSEETEKQAVGCFYYLPSPRHGPRILKDFAHPTMFLNDYCPIFVTRTM